MYRILLFCVFSARISSAAHNRFVVDAKILFRAICLLSSPLVAILEI